MKKAYSIKKIKGAELDIMLQFVKERCIEADIVVCIENVVKYRKIIDFIETQLCSLMTLMAVIIVVKKILFHSLGRVNLIFIPFAIAVLVLILEKPMVNNIMDDKMQKKINDFFKKNTYMIVKNINSSDSSKRINEVRQYFDCVYNVDDCGYFYKKKYSRKGIYE